MMTIIDSFEDKVLKKFEELNAKLEAQATSMVTMESIG